MMWLLTCTLLCVVALSNCDDSEWRHVRTAQGEVRGRRDPDGGLYSFYNIPYATVPKGADRFQAPLPPPAWLKPLEAVDQGIICLQPLTPLIDLSSKTMQEDCLIANVYVPDTDDKDLPVIVQVHGGAFEVGYGNLMGTPKNFVKTKKVIVVTFNYRLGVHGFLCLGTKDVPGNAGMKDQLALLRWVKRNIANFGGNPDNVTISGYSAGSVSVDLLMLSKSAEGLFNKVILESGASVGYISIQADPLENAQNYAKKFNFTDVKNLNALEEFYKATTLPSLVGSTFSPDGSVVFVPCVERKTGKAFLDDFPINIIKKGGYKKVPYLIGISNMEGSLQMNSLTLFKDDMNTKFSKFLPPDLQFENEEEREEISKKVKEFYFGDQLVGEETMLAYVDYFSDVLFGYPTLRSVKLHVEAGHDQIYLYEYSFVDDTTPVIPFTNVRRAPHCAQTDAVYGPFLHLSESSLSEERQRMKTTMREMWYNFAIHGMPVPEGPSLPAWPVSSADGGPYMSLGKPVELSEVFLGERGRFWDDIYQKYSWEPVLPSLPPSENHTEL